MTRVSDMQCTNSKRAPEPRSNNSKYKSVRPQTHHPISLASLARVEKRAASPLHMTVKAGGESHSVDQLSPPSCKRLAKAPEGLGTIQRS